MFCYFSLLNFINFTWKSIYVDHTRRTFVTAYPNLVMKSQKYAKSQGLSQAAPLRQSHTAIEIVP